MLSKMKIGIYFILFAFLVTGGLCSEPDDYPDVSSDYTLNVIFGESPSPNDQNRTSNDFVNDPSVPISSDEESSEDEDTDNDIAVEAFQDLKATKGTGDDPIVERTLADLLLLSKIMDQTVEYDKARKQDPKRPSKVGPKVSTPQENQAIRQDVTGMVVLQMMEERATFLNNYMQDRLSTKEAEAGLTKLIGGSNSLKELKGMLNLKYLEGLLHAANILINGSITLEKNDQFSTDERAVSEERRFRPSSVVVKNEDDPSSTIGPYLLLGFAAIGFLFVLFVIVYTAYKLVQRCYEARNVSLDGRRNKSKYERI